MTMFSLDNLNILTEADFLDLVACMTIKMQVPERAVYVSGQIHGSLLSGL